MKNIIIVMGLALLSGCAGSHYMTATGYLGIPEHEWDPDKGKPVPEIREYHVISAVIEVPYEDYLKWKQSEQTMYEVTRGSTVYFSVEMDAELDAGNGDVALVPALERRKTTKP